MQIEIEHPAAATDLPSVGLKLAESFGFPVADADGWFQTAGPDQVTALRIDGAIVGGLIRVPHAQFFGGRSVPALGIAGVGVAPEARRTGAARALMIETLRQARAAGVATSNLYPATHALYESVGYGVAGTRHSARVLTSAIRVAPEPGLEIRRLTEAELPAMKALYTAHARLRPGHLDRGPYVWVRTLRTWRDRPAYATGVFEGDRLVGYVTWRRAASEPPSDVQIGDVVAPSASVARRIWGFLKDHSTMAPAITGFSSPTDPFWQALSWPGPELALSHLWMLRLVDLPAAITARGYPGLVDVRVGLSVDDDVLPENAGLWTLHVQGGRGTLTRGGTPEAFLGIGALAGLFSGLLDPSVLMARGALAASDTACERLAAVFSGPAPWLPDMF